MNHDEIRKFALEHYNEGGDGLYECWDDWDIEEFLLDPDTGTTEDEIKKSLLKSFRIHKQIMEEIKGW